MLSRAPAVGLHPVTVACAVAALTVVRQGFEFGINNNAFHIPLVLGWAALPQFVDDLTIQSLSSFVTPVYPALALILDESTIRPAFFVMHVVTRWLTCLALYRLIGLVGVTDRLSRAAALAVVCLVTPAYGFTPVAKAGMFLSYFTHTELAQAIALFALASMVAGRLDRAGWLAGLAFLTNAFVGVWLLVPLGCAAAGLLSTPRRRAALRPLLVGAAGFAVCAAPLVVWMLRLPADPVTFDYRAFLVDYFPDHFLLRTQSRAEGAQAAALLASAFAVALVLPRDRTSRVARLLGVVVAVFVVGVVVGRFATSRYLLNLHLLRVDGLISWLCLAVTGAGISLALATRHLVPSVAACAVIVALCFANRSPGWLVLAAIGLACFAGGAWRPHQPWRQMRLSPVGAVLLFVIALGASHRAGWVDNSAPWPIAQDAPPTDRHLVGQSPARPEWAAVKAWAAEETPPASQFLIPLQFEEFRIGARRRAWVDWKEGAAAMWAPHTYSRWRKRLDEVRRLDSVAALLGYAGQHGVDFVVFDKRIWPAEALASTRGRLAFENRWFAVAQAR